MRYWSYIYLWPSSLRVWTAIRLLPSNCRATPFCSSTPLEFRLREQHLFIDPTRFRNPENYVHYRLSTMLGSSAYVLTNVSGDYSSYLIKELEQLFYEWKGLKKKLSSVIAEEALLAQRESKRQGLPQIISEEGRSGCMTGVDRVRRCSNKSRSRGRKRRKRRQCKKGNLDLNFDKMIHQACWMSKTIYNIKVWLLRSQFKLSATDSLERYTWTYLS